MGRQALNTLFRKAKTLWSAPVHTLRSKLFRETRLNTSSVYLARHGILDLLGSEHKGMAPDIVDLAHLHAQILRRKPKTVMEFGSGQSTVVIAHALSLLEKHSGWKDAYKLFSVDGNKEWSENTRAKIPEVLKHLVDIRYSRPVIDKFNDRICHRHEELPNITPHFIYLDGPDPHDVEGKLVASLSLRSQVTIAL